MTTRAVRELAALDVDMVILAGGLGTRLGGLLTDLPKIMAPVGGRPFLDYLLEWLILQGARRVVLSLGHKAAPVVDYLKVRRFSEIEIVPLVEPQPLGTAGAVGFAFPFVSSNPAMVMNGDTFVEADLAGFVASHRKARAAASVLCAKVNDPRRYGRVEIDAADRIARFEEKRSTTTSPAWVNAGVYLFDRALLGEVAKLKCGSLERDVLEVMPPGSIHAFRTASAFLDIGTPESLEHASTFFESRRLCREEVPF